MAAKPWDRKKAESEQAHAAFLTYRDMGVNRSIERLSLPEQEGGGKSRATIGRWSSRYSWVERCRAWDNDLQAQRDSVLRADARKWERRRVNELEAAWTDVQSLRERARKMLAFPLSTQTVESKDGKTITTIKPARWTMGQAALMIRLAAEIGAAIGAATARDPHDMTDAELLGIEDAIEGDA